MMPPPNRGPSPRYAVGALERFPGRAAGRLLSVRSRGRSAPGLARAGMLLVLLTPCIDYVVTFVHLGRADARALLAAAPALLGAQMLLLPVYLGVFLDGQGAALVQWEPFVRAFVWLIALPLAPPAAGRPTPRCACWAWRSRAPCPWCRPSSWRRPWWSCSANCSTSGCCRAWAGRGRRRAGYGILPALSARPTRRRWRPTRSRPPATAATSRCRRPRRRCRGAASAIAAPSARAVRASGSPCR